MMSCWSSYMLCTLMAASLAQTMRLWSDCGRWMALLLLPSCYILL